jgi:hypothetical protein
LQLIVQLSNLDVSGPLSSAMVGGGPQSRAGSLDEDEDEAVHSPVRSGPPSEASSHEWDKLGESTQSTA